MVATETLLLGTVGRSARPVTDAQIRASTLSAQGAVADMTLQAKSIQTEMISAIVRMAF